MLLLLVIKVLALPRRDAVVVSDKGFCAPTR